MLLRSIPANLLSRFFLGSAELLSVLEFTLYLSVLIFLSLFLRFLKLIAHTPHGNYVIPVFGDVVSYVLDMRIDYPVIAEKIVSPYICKQLPARKSHISVFHKIKE